MSNKRKKKKAEREARAAQQKSKAKPSTSVGEAMDKAKSKLPTPKVITGFGKKPDGTVIHAVTNLENSALCDARIKMIAIDDDLTIKDVNCAKCQKYVVFKQLLQTAEPKAPDKKAGQKKKGVKTKKAADKPKKEVKPEDKSEEVDGIENEEIDSMFETLKNLMSVRLRKMEKRVISKMEKYCQNLLDERPRFFIARKANNMFQIIHDPSRYVICDNVKESDAEELLQEYLQIECRWDGQTKPSSEWLTAIRKIHESHFPKGAAKAKDKGKRSLKRRKPKPSIKRRKDSKPERRRIKRRSK